MFSLKGTRAVRVPVRGRFARAPVLEPRLEEAARRVACDASVEALADAIDHGGVGVDELGPDAEVIVVDDDVDASGERLEAAGDDAFDLVDVARAVDVEPLEIDEQHVAAAVVFDA